MNYTEVYLFEEDCYSNSLEELTTKEIAAIKADYEAAKTDSFMKVSCVFICIDWSITMNLLNQIVHMEDL